MTPEQQLRALPVVKAPDHIWYAIQAQQRNPWHWARAAAVFLALGGSALWLASRPAPSGQWIETGLTATRTIPIGSIGHVELAPQTRLRIDPNSYRMTLARGEIHATVVAPPRLFVIDTPSTTVVDLGCEYILRTDDDGNGFIKVIKGWVSLEWGDYISLVPAGASCSTRAKQGPGIPYFHDVSDSFREAVERMDTSAILSGARARDTLTLWHLLQRVPAAERPRVFDKITKLAPLPAMVSRERALQLEPETLRLWREELAWTW